MGAAELEALLANGGEVRGPHWLVWRPALGVWTTALWDQPSSEEIAALVHVFDVGFVLGRNQPYVSLVDCTGLRLVDGAAFAALTDYMQSRKGDHHRWLKRQAVVRPGGMVGTIVSGFLEVLEYRVPVRVFNERGVALDWLLDGNGAPIAAELERRVARARQVAPVVRELQTLLEEQPSLDVAGAARALARSARTLQRQLDEAGTTFRAQSTEVRLGRAERLLAETDQKITAIAVELGYESPQHFARVFRAHAGVTPLAWRRRHRGGAGYSG
jgi:AraC-like DNA-binding protein